MNIACVPSTLVSKGSYNYIYQESLHVPKWLNSARLDYNFSQNTQFFARFNYWYEDQQGAGSFERNWDQSPTANAVVRDAGARCGWVC